MIGGGVAGSVTAMRLAELGIDTTLIEKGRDIVNGPPICHLHAGGNLYREISDQQCLTLLKQSIDTVKEFSACVNWRPTVIAVPKRDPGSPEQLLPRLNKLQKYYAQLIDKDPENQVLGEAEDYFRSFSRQELEHLAHKPLPEAVLRPEDWLIPVAKQLDLDKLQFPVYLVQEYGLSSFRFSAMANMAIERMSHCTLLKNHKVTEITQEKNLLNARKWRIEIQAGGQTMVRHFDFVINAGGYKSGELDDMLGLKRQRYVEFKAAYLSRWPTQAMWPEVIFHGQRGSAEGMSQMTPYPQGYFQLHGMTEDITLFKDGLVASDDSSAQPRLAEHLQQKLNRGWNKEELHDRTRAAIEHAAYFVPSFSSASVAGKPLYGAQQIPGDDPSLRAVDVFNSGLGYVGVEIVKASSALAAADKVLLALKQYFGGKYDFDQADKCFRTVRGLNRYEIIARAQGIARERNYPEAIAQVYAERSQPWAAKKLS